MPAKPLYRFQLTVGDLILAADAVQGEEECRLRVKRKGNASQETTGDLNVAGAQAFADTLATAARLSRADSPYPHATSYARGSASAPDCDFTLHVNPSFGEGHNVQLSQSSSNQRAEQLKDEQLEELALFFRDLGQALAGPSEGDEGHGPGPRSRLSPLGE